MLGEGFDEIIEIIFLLAEFLYMVKKTIYYFEWLNETCLIDQSKRRIPQHMRNSN